MPIWGWICAFVAILFVLFLIYATISDKRMKADYEDRGERMIGWIVQANPVLYEPGNIANCAQILVAFDGPHHPGDVKTAVLSTRVAALKGTHPEEPDKAAVAKLVNDESYRPFQRFLLPKSFADGRKVYSMHVWVERSKLPDRRLQHPFVRVLVIRDDEKARPLMVEYEDGDNEHLSED